MTVFVGGQFVVLGYPLVGPGGTIAFGPFATRDEAQRWLDDRPDVVAGAAIAELFDATGREHDDATQFVINYPATRPPVRSTGSRSTDAAIAYAQSVVDELVGIEQGVVVASARHRPLSKGRCVCGAPIKENGEHL